MQPITPYLVRSRPLVSARFFRGQHVRPFMEGLVRAMGGATDLAGIGLPGRAEKWEPAKTLEREADLALTEAASVDVLQNLRHVEFAPLALLERALRDPEQMHSFNATEFEEFIAQLVDGLGFEDVVVTPRTADGGRDVLATKHVHGLPILFAFECKKFAPDRAVGVDVARALLGVISHEGTRANKGVLVTSSRFTKGAKDFLISEVSLDGRDFLGVTEWLHEYGRVHSGDIAGQ